MAQHIEEALDAPFFLSLPTPLPATTKKMRVLFAIALLMMLLPSGIPILQLWILLLMHLHI